MRIGIIGSGSASREPPEIWQPWIVGRTACELELINPRFVTFAYSAYERLLVDVGYVDAAQQAEAAGCDVVVINSFADYGIEAARAALAIPVIGAGEAALQHASMQGTRPFSIVTVWPESMRFLYEERLRATGLDNWCRAIHHVSGEEELALLAEEVGVMAQMARGESLIIDRLARRCEIALERDGTDVIVLGCTCMAPVGEALSRRLRAPVIEPSRTAIEQALSLPRARSGKAAIRRDQIPQLIDAWLQQHPAQLSGATDCPVCIVQPDGE